MLIILLAKGQGGVVDRFNTYKYITSKTTRLTKCFISHTDFNHKKFNGCSEEEEYRHIFVHAKTLA